MDDGDADGLEDIGDAVSGGGARTQSTHSELDQGDQGTTHHSHRRSFNASIAQISWATRAPMALHGQIKRQRFQEEDGSIVEYEISASQNQCTRSEFELPGLIDSGPLGSHMVQAFITLGRVQSCPVSFLLQGAGGT